MSRLFSFPSSLIVWNREKLAKCWHVIWKYETVSLKKAHLKLSHLLFIFLELPPQNNSTVHDDLDNAYELDNLNNKQSSSSPNNNGDDEEKAASGYDNANGLGVLTAAIFIIGEICGAGAISFPQALSKTGIYGEQSSFFLLNLQFYIRNRIRKYQFLKIDILNKAGEISFCESFLFKFSNAPKNATYYYSRDSWIKMDILLLNSFDMF